MRTLHPIIPFAVGAKRIVDWYQAHPEAKIGDPELEKEMSESLDGIEALTLDLEKLDYISSAGLRVLLSAQKVMNRQGKMKVIHVNEIIMEIFEVTGFSDILTIE